MDPLMPDPFKNIYNSNLVAQMAENLARVSSEFERDAFESHACDGLDNLEFSARADQISRALDLAFPKDFALKRSAFVAALHPDTERLIGGQIMDSTGIAGWAVEPMARVIARDGLSDPKDSLDALVEMTKRATAEFAVRPFFREFPELTLDEARCWASDPNMHVRRLASEGARPRLPWGIKLHQFVKDPEPLLPILNLLKDDPKDYVRRSVANNLNDIAKDHPDVVVGVASQWLNGASQNRRRLVKHACRTLIKQGHLGALSAFGYETPKLKNIQMRAPSHVTLGDTVQIEVDLISMSDQKLLVDYVVHFMRQNGKLSPKVFKWTELKVARDEVVQLRKSHAYKAVTTRKDYPGAQKISVQVNGVTVAETDFILSL